MKDPPLTIVEVMADPVRWDVAARDEPNDYLSSAFLELRLGVSCTHAQFHDFLRASAPAFNQASQVEHIRQ
jgi:hypothetical protein